MDSKEFETMTWKEIKKAVEEAGVSEDDEIALIQCENAGGDRTFHKMRLGKATKLAENIGDLSNDASGCAV